MMMVSGVLIILHDVSGFFYLPLVGILQLLLYICHCHSRSKQDFPDTTILKSLVVVSVRISFRFSISRDAFLKQCVSSLLAVMRKILAFTTLSWADVYTLSFLRQRLLLLVML